MTEPKTEPTSTPSSWGYKSGLLQISRSNLPSAKAQILFWALFAAGLAADLWTKSVVFERWAIGQSHPVIEGLLSWSLSTNNGAAFGICAGQPLFLKAASVIAVVLVLVYFYLWGQRQMLAHIAMGILAAGICGNMYDRLFNQGAVRDFIDVYITVSGRERHWDTFNVADALLCIGVFLLIVWTSFSGKSDQKHAQPHK